MSGVIVERHRWGHSSRAKCPTCNRDLIVGTVDNSAEDDRSCGAPAQEECKALADGQEQRSAELVKHLLRILLFRVEKRITALTASVKGISAYSPGMGVISFLRTGRGHGEQDVC